MNYHTLEMRNTKLNEVRAVFHIPIPNENNSVGINLRTALVDYLRNKSVVSVVPDLETVDSTEYAQIVAGEIFEHDESFKFSNAHSSLGVKQDEMDNRYVTLSSSVVTKIQKILSFYGKGRDV